jgi:hypothetical protein
MPWVVYCTLYMQIIFEKCPFKETGKLSKRFHLILRGLNLSAVPETSQKKICLGIRPSRTRSCRVSDPAELVLRGIRPRRTMTDMNTFYSKRLFCGVPDPAEQSSAGYQTAGNNF